MTDDAPICAIATAAGRGGIGVVRVSGKSLESIIQTLCGRALLPRHAHYLPFIDDDGSAIDRGIAIHYPAPHSYTGEDVLELQGHGGPVVLQVLLRRVLQAGRALGLRLAQPGEFTQRAFLNDKLDLAQAEAVADLIDASTEQAARSATRSLCGEFSALVHELVERLTHLRMLVEATLDFPEEEIDFLEAAGARARLARLVEDVAALRRAAQQGALLRDGLTVVIAGAPNVGKSSLLNALAGAEVAIVTPIAGTTRDRVTQSIQIEGVPIHVVDTAGLRETDDEVERIGIERTYQALEGADVVLLLRDATTPDQALALDVTADARLVAHLPARVPLVVVHNKIDLSGGRERVDETGVWLSARTGAGLLGLRQRILELAGGQAGGESTFIARERHLDAIAIAERHLHEATRITDHGDAQLDLFAEELRLTQLALGAITGAFSADDLLGVIFSKFCIGK